MKQPIKSALSVSAGVVAIVGLVLAPAAATAVAETANTTVTATVGSTISITTSGAVALAITPTAGGSTTSASDTVTVNTNNTAGYNLTLSDSDATTTLAKGADTLAAHAGTYATPTALAANTWGFAIPGATTFDASYSALPNVQGSTTKWAGVPALGSAQSIKSTASVAANDVTTVWYAANVTTAKPNGAYVGTVTYTATTNP